MVAVGETDGFAAVDVNPAGLLVHAYVLPLTAAAPILIEFPVQMLVLEIVAAFGIGLTVMVTEFDFLHPVAVFVSVTV